MCACACAHGRYSLFLVLYPVGIACGEMPLYHAALPYLRARGLHSLSLPNALNFSFDYYRACQARCSSWAVFRATGCMLSAVSVSCDMPCRKAHRLLSHAVSCDMPCRNARRL
jgi:hypothetical protein